MVYKVLVVDDSSFFQLRLKEMINEHPELSVVGVAANGQEAIAMAELLRPDVISMDYEMPYLDGVSAVRAILAVRAVPIIMFSSMTYEGARITLDAMAAGAVDFIAKNFSDVSHNSTHLRAKLHETLLMFARQSRAGAPARTTAPKLQPSSQNRPVTSSQASPATTPSPRPNLKNKIKLVVIGASTGGPVALTEVIQKLPKQFPVPVVVIQHMPETFTKALAERLDKQCEIAVSEAKDGDAVEPGRVLVAPGGHQLMFDRRGHIKIVVADSRVCYRPSVDIAFASASNVYGAGVLGVVLTGMGADGCEGARLLKQKGAVIWSQDQASCVIYGMPKAVAFAQLTDEVIQLKEIGARIAQDL